MKSFSIVLITIVLSVGFISNKIIDDKVRNLLSQFKINEEYAKSQILSNITGPSYYIPNVRVIKSLALNERAELVKAIGGSIKEYVNSEEFIKNYNIYRENRKPSPPEEPKYSEQLKKEQKESLIKSMADMEKQMSSIPSDQKPMFEEIIKQFKQQLKDIDDPNNTMYSPEMDIYIKQSYDMQMDNYKTQLAEWEKEYPVNNPKPIIKNWINSFLEKSEDIDFNAELKNEKGKQVFVNPNYERKDYQWKLYFRAGKESVDAARAFAQQWLKELQ